MTKLVIVQPGFESDLELDPLVTVKSLFWLD